MQQPAYDYGISIVDEDYAARCPNDHRDVNAVFCGCEVLVICQASYGDTSTKP